MNATMKSFVMGMLPGAVSRAQFPAAQPEKEPIGFLYGHVAKEGETPTHTIDGVGYVGAVLPKLPEWDEEKYPHAAVFYISITKKYILRCLTVDAHYEMPNLVANSGISCSTTGDVWSEFGENTTDAYIPINVSIQPLVWTNFVAEYDGITYMTASDPIPVYE